MASEINQTSLTLQVDDGPPPPKVASTVEIIRKASTSSQSKKSTQVISPAITNWGQYTIPTYPATQSSSMENIAFTTKNEKATPLRTEQPEPITKRLKEILKAARESKKSPPEDPKKKRRKRKRKWKKRRRIVETVKVSLT